MASPTTSRKTTLDPNLINTDENEKTPLLASTQSAEAPASSKVKPQTSSLKTTPLKYYLEDDDESTPLLSDEEIAKQDGCYNVIVANDDAYTGLLANIEKHPNGVEFLGKIDQPLFEKMFIEFFSKNPGFGPNQEIKIEQSAEKFHDSENHASNKLTVGEFKYKVLTWNDNAKVEGTFDYKTGQLTKGKITWADDQIHEGTFDPATGNLTKGKITFADGKIEEGTFKPKTGHQLEHKIKRVDGKTYSFDPDFDKDYYLRRGRTFGQTSI